jgi:Fe-S-cluster containining protein
MSIERLSRPQRRALEREDEAMLAQPLTRGEDERALAAHIRRMVKHLRDADAASPSARTIAHIGAVFDRSVPAPARNAVACRAGCAHCCRQRVAVTAAEAFALAHVVRTRATLAGAVTAADQRTRGLDGKQRLDAAIDCPLLAEQKCAVYPSRPLACRAAAAVDVSACIALFINRQDDAPMRAPLDYTTVSTKCKLALCAALTIVGRAYTYYELNAAVAVALADPASEARWLKGEDVLAPAAMRTVTPDAIAARIDALARAIEATV